MTLAPGKNKTDRVGFQAAVLAALALGGCHSPPPESAPSTGKAAPAVLSSADGETLEKVRSVLAGAMNTATVKLGAGDPTKTPVIPVLPPKPGAYEGRSMAMPTLFDIVLKDGACFLMRRKDGAAFPLDGVACRPLIP